MEKGIIAHIIIIFVLGAISHHVSFGGALGLPDSEDLFIHHIDTYFEEDGMSLAYQSPKYLDEGILVTVTLHVGTDIPKYVLDVFYNLSYTNGQGIVTLKDNYETFRKNLYVGTYNYSTFIPIDPGADGNTTLILKTYMQVNTDNGKVIIDRYNIKCLGRDIGLH